MNSLTRIIFIFITVLTSCDNEDEEVQPDPQQTDTDFSILTTIMEDNLDAFNGDAGLVLMDKDGEILYKKYFGSYSDNTYIPIASGSKLPSMATIMALVDDPGLDIGLNDKVSKFFPNAFLANDRKDITLRQLMTHTSGLEGSSRWISFNNITVEEAALGVGEGGTINSNSAPAADMPYAPPGSKFAYGGVSMQVAGGVAEKVTGKKWDVIFNERIADKCEMPQTNYLGLGVTTNYRIAGGAGTRMMEYANFLLMLLNEGEYKGNKVLSKESVNEILENQTSGIPIASTPYKNDPLRASFQYGLGCWVEEYTDGNPTVFSDQGAFGFSPWIDTKREVIGVLFVRTSLSRVNILPSPENAPYTLIRNKINEIIDLKE